MDESVTKCEEVSQAMKHMLKLRGNNVDLTSFCPVGCEISRTIVRVSGLISVPNTSLNVTGQERSL